MMLPATSTVTFEVPQQSRMEAIIAYDGVSSCNMRRGDQLHIRAAKHPIFTYTRGDPVTSWLQGVSLISRWHLPQLRASSITDSVSF